MKLVLVVLSLLLSSMAQASFFQESCSSAEQAVVLNSGHVSNELSVLVYSDREKKRLQLDRFETIVEYLNEETIKEENYSSCDESSDSSGGYASWDKYSVKSIVITNKDGSAFTERIYGLSQDQKSISATIFCHKSINSPIMCTKN